MKPYRENLYIKLMRRKIFCRRWGRAGWTPGTLAFPTPTKVSFWRLDVLRDVRRFECVIEWLLADQPKVPQKSLWTKAGVWSPQCSDSLHHSVQKWMWRSALPLLNSVISSASLNLVHLGFPGLEVSEGWPRALGLSPLCAYIENSLRFQYPGPTPKESRLSSSLDEA